MDKFIKVIKGNKLLFFLIGIFIFLKLPSLSDPAWHPDEGIYSALAQGIDQGQLLYKDIWDNKPPLIYYTYFLVYKIFGYSVFNIHFFVLIIDIIAFYFFYKCQRMIFPKINPIFACLVFIFFFSSPLLDGNVANAENIFILFDMLGLFFFLKYFISKNIRFIFLFGLSFGIGFMYKIHPLFEFIALCLILLLNILNEYHKTDNILIIKKLFLTIIGFAIPTLFFLIVFLIQGNLSDFIKMFFSQGSSYIELNQQNTNIILTLFSSLIFRSILLVGLTIIILFYYKKHLKKSEFNNYFEPKYLIFISFIWTVYAVLFSGKEYAHYILQVIPATIFLGVLIYTLINRQKLLPKIVLYMVTILVLFSIIFIFFHKSIEAGKGDGANLKASYYFTYCINYYPNFIKLLARNITQSEYDSQFYSNVNQLNQLVYATTYLKGEEVFVFADLPWYYSLARVKDPIKYSTIYHFDLDHANIDALLNTLLFKNAFIIVDDRIKYSDQIQNYVNINYIEIQVVNNYHILKMK